MNRFGKVGLVLGVAAALCGCRTEVARDLSASDAEEVMLALDEAGIAAAREPSPTGGPERFDVWVERDALVPAMARLREDDLPRPARPGLDATSGALLPSVAEETRRTDAAVAEELRRSIEQLAGVHRARVHVARDLSPRPLDEAALPPRASVLLLSRGEEPDQDAVRALVVGAVHGLRAENVAVVVEAGPERAPRSPAQVFVGPIAVSRASAGPLRGALATALALNLLLAGALVVQRRRART
ncbi:MAG: hypothetical protein AB8I08_17485 [Sandaracinaceae bacterium]